MENFMLKWMVSIIYWNEKICRLLLSISASINVDGSRETEVQIPVINLNARSSLLRAWNEDERM